MNLTTQERISTGLSASALLIAFIALAAPLGAAGTMRTQAAEAAVSDGFALVHSDHALSLPPIGESFLFLPGAELVEHSDGTGRLAGTLVDRDEPSRRFLAEIWLGGYSEKPPLGIPSMGLDASAYVAADGPVDPAGWRYYRQLAGRLLGGGELAGAVLDLGSETPFQIGFGANNRNILYGASGEVEYRQVRPPRDGSLAAAEGKGSFHLELDVARCADRSDADPVYSIYQGGHALWLPGIGEDFVFDARPGALVEAADGDAVLGGIARRASNPAEAFEVELVFTERLPRPPYGMAPKKELRPAAYVENGGPIDSDGWWYYRSFEGRLTGIEEYAGARIELHPFGPVFQLGVGANGKNLRLGASTWLLWTVLAQPSTGHFQASGQGDLSLDLATCVETCLAATPPGGAFAGSPSTPVLRLEGIGEDFVFARPASLYEYMDMDGAGGARLVGTLSRLSEPAAILEMAVRFEGRRDRAPAGTPDVPALGGAAPGPSDTLYRWTYEAFEGVLTGTGLYAGAEIEITRAGAPFQLGAGAAGGGSGDGHGGSGELAYTVVGQPHVWSLPHTGSGELSFRQCGP